MKKVVITIGDPAGCGPFVSLKAIWALRKKRVDFLVVGDYQVLKEFPLYKRLSPRIELVDLATPGIRRLRKGFFSYLSGRASLAYLDKALEIIKQRGIRRLVTAPVSKEALRLILPNFSGHTEYLAQYFGKKEVEMMMVAPNLRVVLFSRHIPLRQVSPRLKPSA